MENWKVIIGAKVKEASLKGPSGKQKKVQVDCDKSDMETVINAVHANLFPLANGNLDGWQRRSDHFFVKVTTIASAVELRDKIFAVMDEYKKYVSGGGSGTGSNTGSTGSGTGSNTGGNSNSGGDDEGTSPIVAVVILAVAAYLLYELI